jgi:hypothetical protein
MHAPDSGEESASDHVLKHGFPRLGKEGVFPSSLPPSTGPSRVISPEIAGKVGGEGGRVGREGEREGGREGGRQVSVQARLLRQSDPRYLFLPGRHLLSRFVS